MSIIKELREKRVVEIILLKEDNLVEIAELCDYNYSMTLDSEDLETLIKELEEMKQILIES